MTDQEPVTLSPDANQPGNIQIEYLLLIFCLPIVGVFLYFANKHKDLKKAKIASNTALWGFIYWFGVAMVRSWILTKQ